jgi:hypothetical protein
MPTVIRTECPPAQSFAHVARQNFPPFVAVDIWTVSRQRGRQARWRLRLVSLNGPDEGR